MEILVWLIIGINSFVYYLYRSQRSETLIHLGIYLSLLVLMMVSRQRDKSINIKNVSIGVLVVVVLLGGFATFWLNTGDGNVSKYHTMTRGLMQYAEDPEDALLAMGIDPSYSLLRGSDYYRGAVLISPDDDLLKKEFYPKISYDEVILFYLTHPSAFFKQLGNSLGGVQDHIGFLPNNSGVFILLLFVSIAYTVDRRIKNSNDGKYIYGFILDIGLYYIYVVGFITLGISIFLRGDVDLFRVNALSRVAFDMALVIIVCYNILGVKGK